jgi:hypothetical protein
VAHDFKSPPETIFSFDSGRHVPDEKLGCFRSVNYAAIQFGMPVRELRHLLLDEGHRITEEGYLVDSQGKIMKFPLVIPDTNPS